MIYRRFIAAGVGALAVVLSGCGFEVTSLLDDNFLSALGLGTKVATLPGDAPGLLVSVENRTDRWIDVLVAYIDADDNAQSYTSTIAPRDKTSQLLACPVSEITLGSLSNLTAPGAQVYLIDAQQISADPGLLEFAPFVEVDAFGVLLQEGVNYDCGDAITFTVQASGVTRSGYRTFAFIRRAGS